ncbi:MAG TPA: hypothetical protein VF584_23650 [Longimicrobium sp.]
MTGPLARRVVTHLPLARLWDEHGFLPHARARTLYEDDAAEQISLARLAVAELGEPLRWFPAGQARAFWAHEAAPRLIPPGTPLLPGTGYGYAASLWLAEDARPVLLLEVRN